MACAWCKFIGRMRGYGEKGKVVSERLVELADDVERGLSTPVAQGFVLCDTVAEAIADLRAALAPPEVKASE